MKEKIILEGIIENIIFKNKDNGYTVCTIVTDEQEYVCVGIMPEIYEGETLKIEGDLSFHNTYGDQVQVTHYEKSIPTTELAIEKYLSSGVIKGIGPKIAGKIVKKFGKQTFHILEKNTERLSEIKGISEEKAKEIGKSFKEQVEVKNIIIFLQQYEITTNLALKIYKKYKQKTIDTLKKNPYKLIDDIDGIGFKIADKIANQIGIGIDFTCRVTAGIKHVLTQYSNQGHTYMNLELLLKTSQELLRVTKESIQDALVELNVKKEVYFDVIEQQDVVYLKVFYYAEKNVAKKILGLMEFEDNNQEENLDTEINLIEKEKNIQLSESQKQAIKETMRNQVLIITGGPGTGKTTIMNVAIELFLRKDKKVMLLAPTGKAAKRMTEATGIEAQTIHRKLEMNFTSEDDDELIKKQIFEKDESNPLETDIVIIDEVSMVDILLMNHLLKAIAYGTKLILVGDSDQLPSVGPGNVLKDLLKSNKIKAMHLTEIFRQSKESVIVLNAHKINKGEYPILNETTKDFFFINRKSPEKIIQTITELIEKRLPEYTKCNPISDIQLLTPMKKTPLGVQNLNNILQQVLNPKSKQKIEKEYGQVTFREGDKIMQIKNNYTIPWKMLDETGIEIEKGEGIFNGEQGKIEKISLQLEKMTVRTDDNKIIEYEFTNLMEIELAYAVTIHKSQGSEYPIVVLPVFNGPYMLMTRNLIYTAITRAKNMVVLVGEPENLYKMVDNNREVERFSSLKYMME